LQKNVDELRESKERYYDKSLDCAKKLKDSFAKVGAYSSEQKFIRGDPEGIIEWIGEEGVTPGFKGQSRVHLIHAPRRQHI
jgi:hypothetical protein